MNHLLTGARIQEWIREPSKTDVFGVGMGFSQLVF